jgi:hypothetical protein
VAGADNDEWGADGLVLEIMTRPPAERAKKMIEIVRMFEEGVKARFPEHNHEQLRQYTDAFVLKLWTRIFEISRPSERGPRGAHHERRNAYSAVPYLDPLAREVANRHLTHVALAATNRSREA